MQHTVQYTPYYYKLANCIKGDYTGLYASTCKTRNAAGDIDCYIPSLFVVGALCYG